MITLIIGNESNLSQKLYSKIKNSILISSRAVKEDIEILVPYKNETINIIFNNFQSSTQLNNLKSCTSYIANAILITSQILDYFQGSDINKIIYTSSSSVYGNNIFCSEGDELKPLNLHSSLKIANEKLIEMFCSDKGIDFTITRIFNMYGGDDRFSVISKIIMAVKKREQITIVNGGNAIRDFIHIDNVVYIYIQLLNIEVKVLNIGTGNGISIKSLLDFLHYRGVDLQINSLERDELKVSTTNVQLLNKLVPKVTFKEIEDYFSKELNL